MINDAIAIKVIEEVQRDRESALATISSDTTPLPTEQTTVSLVARDAVASNLGLDADEFTARAEACGISPFATMNINGQQTAVYEARFIPMFRHFTVTLWNKFSNE